MIKATAETFWQTQSTQELNVATEGNAIKWLNKAKQTLRHLVGFTARQEAQFTAEVINSESGIVAGLILRQQHKLNSFEQGIKEEFFNYPMFSDSKVIPQKTWKRHSAFLVYRQQMLSQKSARTLEAANPAPQMSSKL